jgi:hypothetical protein
MAGLSPVISEVPSQAADRVFGQNVFSEKASALTGPAHGGTNNFRLKRLGK